MRSAISRQPKAGLHVDDFAPRLAFFFASHRDFFEEIAKFRAARRLYARIMSERFQANKPESMMLRFHTQTSGVTLTAQQRDNNVVRVSLQALAAVLGGTQSLHTNSKDEAFGCRLKNQSTRRSHPAGDRLRNRRHKHGRSAGRELLRRAFDRRDRSRGRALITQIDAMGGMVAAIESGFARQLIDQAAFLVRSDRKKERIIVGVNAHTDEEPPHMHLSKWAKRSASAKSTA